MVAAVRHAHRPVRRHLGPGRRGPLQRLIRPACAGRQGIAGNHRDGQTLAARLDAADSVRCLLEAAER
ncbi:hypothetical protein DMA10_20825 [Streptomyces sp. WAC 01420]|nr:hypothetical protein DLM49_35890 [Streptomyces sp. WAC 01438]RSM93453.1 hypothetical protein DMA10_20825 [Streptomyces sp. WAC 01420]